ncbi:hypothetical protein C7A11_25075 [Pseudomonas simiae]|uniref:hypothetical protein n=1 Tax=Pseudomonas simiae TaxID=321846 RepID=UPI000D03C5CE|nr:hypothetical protein [Pseudomonas simiae]PRW84823.1 hypothetical protein C7A11_25075 [Pseudomonas simiae]
MAGNGVEVCREGFERIKAGKPRVAAHVGLDPTKVTAGIVSVESGFDRGYLKKDRPNHRPLIAEIEAYRKSFGTVSSSKALQIKRANDKATKSNAELEIVRGQLYQVMTQNVQLVERVRHLEEQLKSLNNVIQLNAGSKRKLT